MSPSLDREFWERHLRELCDRLRAATQDSLRSAGGSGDLSRPVSMGAGDRTFGLDVPAEEVCSAWLEEMARQTPLSLLTEDAGWRHRGPDADRPC